MPAPEFILALRRHVGHAELWLPGVTAVVRRGDDVLLVRRSDTGEWAPVSGILEPGEEPAVAAVRETLEETGVAIRVDRLASVTSGIRVTYGNGDAAVYLDHTFACSWLAGEAHVADDESVDVGWFPATALPRMRPDLRDRLDAALSPEVAARFRA